ncbi:MAG: hypothetical protein RLZZ15_2192 [Verrucomicrobiota bacterium]
MRRPASVFSGTRRDAPSTTPHRAAKRCGSDIALAAPLVETALLGVAAIRTQTRLERDAAAGRITNSAAANHFLAPGYDYRPDRGV